MPKEKIEFSAPTPSFIKKLLNRKEGTVKETNVPVDDGPVVVNQVEEPEIKRENRIVEIGAKKILKKQKKSSKKTLSNTKLLSFTNQDG